MPQFEVTDAGLDSLTSEVWFRGKSWAWKSEEIAVDRHKITLTHARDPAGYNWPAE